MTPAETEHFAALRMHVARLHAALKVFVDAGADTVLAMSDYQDGAAALAISEPDVRDLLKEADRDNALVQARAERDAAIDATMAIGKRCTAIEASIRHLLAVYRGEDAGTEEWRNQLTAAIEQLAVVLPE